MGIKAIDLLKNLHADVNSIYQVGEFLGLDIEKVESVRDLFDVNTIFAILRPNNMEGLFGYISIQPKLTASTRANQYKSFFQEAVLAMEERGQTSLEVDFIIIVGENVLIFIDSADYRRRLILTEDKLSRNNSKYYTKLESLKSPMVLSQGEAKTKF